MSPATKDECVELQQKIEAVARRVLRETGCWPFAVRISLLDACKLQKLDSSDWRELYGYGHDSRHQNDKFSQWPSAFNAVHETTRTAFAAGASAVTLSVKPWPNFEIQISTCLDEHDPFPVEDAGIPLTAAQLAEARRRLADYRLHPENVESWETVKARILGQA